MWTIVAYFPSGSTNAYEMSLDYEDMTLLTGNGLPDRIEVTARTINQRTTYLNALFTCGTYHVHVDREV